MEEKSLCLGLDFIEEKYNIVPWSMWQPGEGKFTIYNLKDRDPITIALNCSSFFCTMGAMNVPTKFKL